MDVLAKLRDDMDMVGCEAAGLGENVLDACLEILDEFIAGYEVLEVVNCLDESYKPPHRRWDEWPVMGRPATTILVPRARKPSLLEAAKTAEELLTDIATRSGVLRAWPKVRWMLHAAIAEVQGEE